MKNNHTKHIRLKNHPDKCNIFGCSYRGVSILIATVLLLQNLSFVVSFIFKKKISCNVYKNGFYSLIIQFGDDYWSLAGLLIALLSLVCNSCLLVGALRRTRYLILLWYIGGLVQFVYLLSFQSFCFITKSCWNNCEMNREERKFYPWAFGWCLALTLYFYLTFIFKIQLFYEYLRHEQHISKPWSSRSEVHIRTSYYRKSKYENK